MTTASTSINISHGAKVRQLYKASVTLNNVACSLLEQGAFQDAMETLNDAVFILKTICASEKSGASIQHDHVVTLPEKIENAYERQKSPRLCHVISSEPPLHHDTSTPPFTILTIEDYHFFEFTSRTLYHPWHTFLCPVRVSEKSCCSMNAMNGYVFSRDLDCASMIYNLSLTYMCLSKCQTTQQDQKDLEITSIKLFELSDTILKNYQDAEGSCKGDQHGCDCHLNEEYTHRVASIHIAVLHSLVQLLFQKSGSVAFEASASCCIVARRLIAQQQFISMMDQMLLKRCLCASAA